jgi:hypothetical protein
MDPERVSLYDPPPAYEEAIDTILYPPTPQMNRVKITKYYKKRSTQAICHCFDTTK